jgi:hypothetical protein
MARNALTAPCHVVLQRNPGQFTNLTSTVQPDSAPSMVYGGGALLDHRMPFNKFNALGNGAMASVVGFANGAYPATLDQAIATAPAAGTGGIAPAANVTSGTPMTLTSATTLTNGALITASALTTMPFGTVIPKGTVVIQSQMAYSFLGLRDITAAYDPTNMCTRVIAGTGVASGTGGAFIVRGWDVYGQPMSETITVGAGVNTVNGKKAWKWIASITPQFTDAHNYSFDVLNIFGLGLAVDTAAYVDAWVAGTGYTANPTVTAADTTSPATATTGDVRGTWTFATPGGNRLTVFVTPSSGRLMTTSANGGMSTGLFGVTNFTQ